MLRSSRDQILARLSDDDVVLDIGGWADPFERADWVIDVMPYETRGLYEREGWVDRREHGTERFTRETWIERDLCDREPYPFADGQIDFIVCSHTLEDLRDPLWVCSEMTRIGRAGYIEVPSRLEEQSFGVYGEFVGWPHHHWLVDAADGRIEFVFKDHEIHARPDCQFPREFWEALSEERRVQTLWWQGGFEYSERIFMKERPADAYLPALVERELGPANPRRRGLRLRRRRRAGS